MHPVKLVGRAAGTATHTLRHPVASVAYAAGLARGLAGAVIAGVTRTGHDPAPRAESNPPTSAPRAPSAGSTPSAPPKPERVPKPVPDPADLPEPVVIVATDEAPGEAFATEPKATSRRSEHGGRSDETEIDEWAAESGHDDGIDIETPVGTTGADVGHNPATAEAGLQQPGTEPLLDPGTAKAVRSEAAMMRKAADPDKG